MITKWNELQSGSAWGRKLIPEMLSPEGAIIDCVCKLIGEKGEKKIRQVLFDKSYCFAMLDRLFQNLSKEQAVSLISEWASNAQDSPN